jgi:outer membrane protein assembly factor BamD (BamD/ComL family)
MQITNQTIHGGNQQFADSIINEYPNAKFEQHDIAELKTEVATKQAAGNDVAIINDHTVTREARENAHNRITQFLLDHKGDISAWAGRVSKIVITAILAKYGLSLADVGLS